MPLTPCILALFFIISLSLFRFIMTMTHRHTHTERRSLKLMLLTISGRRGCLWPLQTHTHTGTHTGTLHPHLFIHGVPRRRVRQAARFVP